MKISVKIVEIEPARLPEDLENWKLVRLDYINRYRYTIHGDLLWLPSKADLRELEELFDKWQEK